MKVLNILGSPRKKGTSSRIAEAFAKEAEARGAVVARYYLNGLSYKGCQACEVCHTKLDHCVLQDDLTAVLDAMRTSDVIVCASPVYYGDVSGQLKMLVDRTWSHVNYVPDAENPYQSRIPAGKTALFILTQGDVEEKHGDIIQRYAPFFELYGYALKVIRAASLTTGAPDEDVSAAQQRAVELARALIN